MTGDPFSLETPSRNKRHRSSRYPSDIDVGPTAGQTSTSLSPLSTSSTTSWVFLLVIIVLIGLFARLLYLQAFSGSTYRLRSEGNRIRAVTTPAPRGLILDRQGRALADNVPDLALTITPGDLPTAAGDRQAVLDRLANLTKLPVEQIDGLVKAGKQRPTDPVTIIEHVPYDQALQYIVSTSDIPAVGVVALPNRTYPSGDVSAAFVGYTGSISPAELAQHPEANPLDVVGKTGLERTYNDVLTGRDGIKQVERDVRNFEQRIIAQQDPVPGKTITTAIDLDLQRLLSERLRKMVRSLRTTGGAAVALDPRNGQVLAMATEPTYDNNWFVTPNHGQDIERVLNDKEKPLLNRAISGQYPSGSIIKPLIAAAALSEGVITANTTINSVGGFKVGNDYFPDWRAGGHGMTNVTKAIADSVNTFFYAVGGGFDRISGLGVDRIVAYLQRFGWGKPTGIDVPNEQDGLLPTKEWRSTERASPWKLGDTYHLSIGQGDLEVTPLQVANGIATIANGGTLYQPSLVTGTKTADGGTVQMMSPRVVAERVVPLGALATVQSGMREGVLNGSSRSLQSLPVSSAAKTGTAQFGAAGKTHAWFAAYAPFERPEIVIAVVVEGGGEGHAAALPVAKDALQWYFTTGPGKKP